ncbi:MAG: polyphenol oxidase family protein [Humidesulfovibrio sp.]|nr:polyphenol oxidase family protein [Humidesulfovibrio sp.]
MVPLGLTSFRFPGLAGVSCVFTTRQGGVSLPPFDGANLSFDVGDDCARVVENRRALAGQLGLGDWCELKQVHGDLLHMEPAPTPLDMPATLEGDAQATSRPGLALVIKTADCQPVLLAHETGRFVAALHVGWRGNVLNLPGGAVERLCGFYGCRPHELYAVRGPSLGPARAQFMNFASEFGEQFMPFFDRKAETVDLWRLTRHQLEAAGLEPARVFGLDQCTQSHPEDYFSYRAARTTGGATGRMMALIWRD